MPIYEMKCGKCKEAIDVVCKFDDRDAQTHDDCGGKLKPLEGRSAPILGKPRYQMKAVMADGSHVKGHFHKAARLKKKK